MRPVKKVSEGKFFVNITGKISSKVEFIVGNHGKRCWLTGRIKLISCGAEQCVLSVQVESSTLLLVWPAISHLINTENRLVSSGPTNLSDVKGKISHRLLHRCPRMEKQGETGVQRWFHGWKIVLFVNTRTVAHICLFDFNIDCLYCARLKARPYWNWQAFPTDRR